MLFHVLFYVVCFVFVISCLYRFVFVVCLWLFFVCHLFQPNWGSSPDQAAYNYGKSFASYFGPSNKNLIQAVEVGVLVGCQSLVGRLFGSVGSV